MIKRISRRETLLRFARAGAYISTRSLAKANSPLNIGGIPVDLALHALSDTTLRITLVPVATRTAVWKDLNGNQVLMLNFQHTHALLSPLNVSPHTVSWGGRKVTTSASPLTIAIDDQDGHSIQSLRVDEQGAVTFKSSSGPVYGLGEGGPQFDRRGQQYSMRNGQFGPLLATIGARLPIPWLISADGWAIFFHEPYGIVNLAGPEYVFEQPATAIDNPIPLDLFFVASREPAEILKAYAQITGFPHLPPLWSLGYQQSHRTLASREEILEEAKKFRSDELPCDTMIYLGTGFCPSGWNTGHGSFTFNQKVFPDPKEVIQELHNEHFHVVLHLTRPPEHLHGRVTDTGAATQDMSDAAYYWDRHLDVFRLGVDGWWPDEGDALPPEGRLTRNRMYWEGPIKDRPNERPFALHRNGFAGMQRYAWLWSGDVDCTWKTLQEQIPVGLNAGLTGLPY
ncbi:MAG: glycoside hydrolase family 31 protein, partial [Acidobacteriaceae bacterium]|nr:glycoside hydrolase family 31 protein [Acidobacteriaceae bacterium]